MLALSGLFFPVDRLPAALRTIAFVLPTTHAVALMQGVWDGSGWGAHWVNAAMLLALFGPITALSTRGVSLGVSRSVLRGAPVTPRRERAP